MATPLTKQHRAWRMKVFAATYLSYVGFYFCRKPFSVAKKAIEVQNHWTPKVTVGNVMASYLIAYAIGAFLASRVGTKMGPRKNLLIAMVMTFSVTLAMGFTMSPWMMAGLAALNGLAQGQGWSSNVGTMANWFHKHERGKVMGAWGTNFVIGSIATTFVFGYVLGNVDPDAQPWQQTFFDGALVMGVIVVLFYLWQRNEPNDVGLPAIDDPATAVDESKEAPAETLTRAQWTNILIVGGFYFCAKLIRYAVWSWSSYILATSYGLKGRDATIYSILFDIGGMPGVFVTGWLSDKFFGSKRGGVSLIMMIGMCVVTLVLVLYGNTSVVVFCVLLGAVGFFLYGPDALLSGAGAMDIGSRKTAMFATATIAVFGALGPIVQEVVIPRVYKEDDPTLVNVLLFASSVLGSLFCALLVWRNRRGGKGI